MTNEKAADDVPPPLIKKDKGFPLLLCASGMSFNRQGSELVGIITDNQLQAIDFSP